MAKKKRPKAKTFREHCKSVHRGQSLGFSRDKARKALGLGPEDRSSHAKEKAGG